MTSAPPTSTVRLLTAEAFSLKGTEAVKRSDRVPLTLPPYTPPPRRGRARVGVKTGFLHSFRRGCKIEGAMKVKINYEDHEVKPGTRLTQIVKMVRKKKKSEPMIQAIVEKTGQDHIVFVVNGRIVQPAGI